MLHTKTQKTILIIEDEKDILTMYSLKLKDAGYKIITAIDGESGLKQAIKTQPDIILLDIILPKIDGFALLTQLKVNKRTKEIPIIMLTNLGQDDDKMKGVKSGAIDYLIKANIMPSDVVKKVAEVLHMNHKH